MSGTLELLPFCVGPALFMFVLCCAPEECLAVTTASIYRQPFSIPRHTGLLKAQDSFFFFFFFFNVGQFGSMCNEWFSFWALSGFVR